MQISDHQYRIITIGGFNSEKTNALLNLICHKADIDKIYLCAKHLYEAKYQLLINKRKGVGIKHFNDFANIIFLKTQTSKMVQLGGSIFNKMLGPFNPFK